MGYSYNKKRGQFEVRENVNGKRTYIGSYPDVYTAMEVSIRHQIAEDIRQHTIENYTLHYEYPAGKVQWFKPFSVWLSARAKRRLEGRVRDGI